MEMLAHTPPLVNSRVVGPLIGLNCTCLRATIYQSYIRRSLGEWADKASGLRWQRDTDAKPA